MGEASKRPGGLESSPRSRGSQNNVHTGDGTTPKNGKASQTGALSQGALAGLTLASTISVTIRTAMAFDDPQIHRWFLTSPIYVLAGLWIDTFLTSRQRNVTSYACAGGFALIGVLCFLPSFFNMAFGIYSMLLSSPVVGDYTMPYTTRVKFMASGLLANMATVALLLFMRWTMESKYYTVIRRVLLLLSSILFIQAQAWISNRSFSIYLIIPPIEKKRDEDQVLSDDGGGSDHLMQDNIATWHRTLSTVLWSRNFCIWLTTELILEALKVLWASLAEKELLLMHKMCAALVIYLPMYFYGYKQVYQILFVSFALMCVVTEIRGIVVSPKWVVAALLCGFQWAGYQLVVADLVSGYMKMHLRHGRLQEGGYGATILGIVAALRPLINMVRKVDGVRDHLMNATFFLTFIQCIVWYQYDVSTPRRPRSPKRPKRNLLMAPDQPASHTV